MAPAGFFLRIEWFVREDLGVSYANTRKSGMFTRMLILVETLGIR